MSSSRKDDRCFREANQLRFTIQYLQDVLREVHANKININSKCAQFCTCGEFGLWYMPCCNRIMCDECHKSCDICKRWTCEKCADHRRCILCYAFMCGQGCSFRNRNTTCGCNADDICNRCVVECWDEECKETMCKRHAFRCTLCSGSYCGLESCATKLSSQTESESVCNDCFSRREKRENERENSMMKYFENLLGTDTLGEHHKKKRRRRK